MRLRCRSRSSAGLGCREAVSRRGRGTCHGISRYMGDVSRPLYTSLASEVVEDQAVMIGRVGVGAMPDSNYSSMKWSMFLFSGSGKEGTS